MINWPGNLRPYRACKVSKQVSLSQIGCHCDVTSDTSLRLARRVGQIVLRLATMLGRWLMSLGRGGRRRGLPLCRTRRPQRLRLPETPRTNGYEHAAQPPAEPADASTPINFDDPFYGPDQRWQRTPWWLTDSSVEGRCNVLTVAREVTDFEESNDYSTSWVVTTTSAVSTRRWWPAGQSAPL